MCPVKINGHGSVGVNAHLLSGQEGYRRAGIHHYIAQIINHLPADDPPLQVRVFSHDTADLLPNPSLQIINSRWRTGRPLMRILWEQTAWPLQAARLKLDLLHSMAFVTPFLSPCPTVVTVYDLSFIHYPERFPILQRLYLTSQTKRSCRAARRVVVISESGRHDVRRLYGLPSERIDVVAPGVDDHFRPVARAQVAAFRQREQLAEPFILHVGTLQPRKNIPLLIEALARLGRPGLRLVLVGGKGWAYEAIFERVTTLGLEQQVRFAGYVPDDDLPLWYNAAALLAFPSVYEGFGLPVAQAMACGTPVVAANTSAIPEVAGEAALLFDPQDVGSLARHIANVLDDPQLAATMREAGLAQARHFSWQEAGRRMADVYRRAIYER
jgi:glycosyltransferase involved in cell wall biosynthesis